MAHPLPGRPGTVATRKRCRQLSHGQGCCLYVNFDPVKTVSAKIINTTNAVFPTGWYVESEDVNIPDQQYIFRVRTNPIKAIREKRDRFPIRLALLTIFKKQEPISNGKMLYFCKKN